MAGVCSTAAHQPLLSEWEQNKAGSKRNEVPMDIDEAPRQPDPLLADAEAPAPLTGSDGSQNRESFRDDIAEDLKALAPRAVQARVVALLHQDHQSCVTSGDSPYASTLTLGLLEGTVGRGHRDLRPERRRSGQGLQPLRPPRAPAPRRV